MFIVLFRAIVLYFVVVFIMRIMGKRQIGQLQPFELVIALMVSELAAMPMQNTVQQKDDTSVCVKQNVRSSTTLILKFS